MLSCARTIAQSTRKEASLQLSSGHTETARAAFFKAHLCSVGSTCAGRPSHRRLQTSAAEVKDKVVPSHSESKRPRIPHSEPKSLDNDSEKSKKLLTPYVLVQRLKKLCDAGKIDEAVHMLQNSPLDAQNVPVWNTLIKECSMAKRYGLAYKLFIDMKRRGFVPTTRTYQTMLSGLSYIEDWSNCSKQLRNAHALYDRFRDHLHALKKQNPLSNQLTITPLVSYIKILGDVGDYQRIFDIYYAMDQEGPLGPNQYIFTAMFQALADRRIPSSHSKMTLSEQNASDARLLWMQLTKAAPKVPDFEFDSHLIAAVMRPLSHGRRTDQELALKIAQDHLDLRDPEQGPTLGKITLTAVTLDRVLELCVNMQQYNLCVRHAEQVFGRRLLPGQTTILERHHIDKMLIARAALAQSGASGQAAKAFVTLQWMIRQVYGEKRTRLRPGFSTYKTVLSVCLHEADWQTALSTFELMTGYEVQPFKESQDGIRVDEVDVQRKTIERAYTPNAEIMFYMIQTAAATKNTEAMKQSLRLAHHVGIKRLVANAGRKPDKTAVDEADTAASYRIKFAAAVHKTVGVLLEKGVSSGAVSAKEMDQLRALRRVVAGSAREI